MPCDYKKYHPSWKTIVAFQKIRAENKCELCDAENGKEHWKTKSKVVLTVHHIDGNLENNEYPNLIVLCQRCHLRLDLEKHMKNARETRKNRKVK